MAAKKPVAKKSSENAPVKASKSSKASKQVSAGNDVACAVLSYFLVGIVWYFADEKMKASALAKRHAKQGLVLLVAWVVLSVLSMVLMMVPVLGYLIWVVIWLALFILWLLGIIQAASGKDAPLPVIGAWAEQFKF